MNNDNNDDRDNDSAAERTPSNSEPETFRKEPTFTLFDNDTELEVDDIEAEDFASDYVTQGYDDEPFDDDEYTDETGPSTTDDDNHEYDERPAQQSTRTPWDDEPETRVTEDQSFDIQAESSLAQGALASTLTAGGDQRYLKATETTMQTTTHTSTLEEDVDEPVAPENELPLEYTEEDSEDDRWEREIDDDDDEIDDDYDNNEYVEEPQKLPIGLIIVALVALALLAAGGYGVIKERAAAQAELTELRARLATAVEQQDIEIERDRVRGLEAENGRLLAQLDALTNDNTTLSGQVDSLQQQLEKASASVTAAPAVIKASPQPVRPSIPSSNSTATPTNSTATGGWFVNFGSYSARAKAQEWADRLQPDSGSVIVAAADSTGGSIYRVRIVGLGSKADAQRIAAQLERTHNLTKLWVGQQ